MPKYLKLGCTLKIDLRYIYQAMAWERTVFEERLEVLRCYIFPPFSRYLPIRRHLDNEIAAVLTFAGTTALALVLWLAGVSTSEERPGLAIIIILWLLDLTLILYSYYLVRKGSRNLLPYI